MSEETLPTFIIGGGMRCGTTYLAETLSRHPDIFMAKPILPEPKVFIGPPQADDVYLERYESLFRDAAGHAARGDKTTHYLENPHLAPLIKRLVPDVRMIFLVREPVARAYSNYLKTKKSGLEHLPFEDAIRLEGRRPSPLPPEKWYARPHAYMSRGDYGAFLEPYFRIFGKDRVRVFLYEDIINRREAFLREIQEFLGVPVRPAQELDAGIVNSAKEVGATIDPRFEKDLRERARPWVARFAAISGIDVTPWGYAA